MSGIDVKSLSKEQKLLLFDVLQEKKRRLKEAGAIYTPNKGQMPIHLSKAKLRCVFSGNGAGKTAMACNEAIYWMKGFNPITQLFTKVPARIIVVLDHPEKVTDLWLPELQKWMVIKDDQLHKRGKPYVTKISDKNGSEILFMFHDQTPLQFESVECDYIIFDEPPPRPVYIALRRGARRKNREPRFLIVGTPITGAWLRKEIFDPWSKDELKDTECFRFSTYCNEENLAEGYADEFGQILTEKEKKIRLEGEFFDLEGQALAHLFDRELHIVPAFPWGDTNPVVVSIDPHPTKPHHAVMLGVDKEGFLYYIKETKRKMVAREFANHIKEWIQGYRVVDLVSDSLGSAEGTGGEGFKSFIQVLRECGVNVRPTTWDDKNDEDFIERIRSAIAVPNEPDNFGATVPKLRFFEGNFGIFNDIENVQWVKHRGIDEYKPKLDISDKDFLSCLKYALATNLTPMKGKAAIYRRTGGMETYGVKETASEGWRRTFRLQRKRLNSQTPSKDDEPWDKW